MNKRKTITILGILIAVLSSIAAATGIFSEKVSGEKTIISVRDEKVELYGKGVYHQMSAEVALTNLAYVVLYFPSNKIISRSAGARMCNAILYALTGYYIPTEQIALAYRQGVSFKRKCLRRRKKNKSVEVIVVFSLPLNPSSM